MNRRQHLLFWAACLLSCVCGQDDIRLPPSIVLGPKMSVIYRNDEPILLECKSGGIPAVSYEWKKNGFELNLNLHNIEKLEDGSIKINNAASLDEGYYQCFAKNQFGVAVSNASHAQRAFIDASSGSAQVLDKAVQEGLPFHLQADPRRSFPKPTYGWELATDTVDKNPESLRESKRVQIAENGDLHFAYAKREDALNGRIYKCTTYNPQMDIKAGGSYAKLTITPSPGGLTSFVPTLGFSSDAQTVALIGKEVALRCFFSGNPEPSISWKGPRNTLPIGRYSIGKFDTELVIRNVIASDEGDYVCTASNAKGQGSHTLQIRVEAEPKFNSLADSPHDVNVTEEGSFTFNCNPEAKPEAKIEWLWNGVPINVEDPPRKFSFSSNRKSLTIKDVCRDCHDQERHTDLMVIQCNASNIHGYAFAAGYLNILSETVVNLLGEKEVKVDVADEKLIKFECNAFSDPSTPPKVRWYRVDTNDKMEPLHDDPPYLTVKEGVLTVHVAAPNGTNKWYDYHGDYKCVADNGYSQASEVVKIIVSNYVPMEAKQSLMGTWWWLFLLIALLLILFIIILCCCLYLQRNKGDKYDVDENERKNGNDPEKELVASGFHDYRRPEGQTLKGSRGSLGSSVKLNSDEEASLNEYGDDPGKFTEDGSFVGAYTNTVDKKKGRME